MRRTGSFTKKMNGWCLAVLMALLGSIPGMGFGQSSGKVPLPVPVVDYEGLRPLIRPTGDTTFVVKFWATWCVPCVQELPYFLALDSVMAEKPFRLILVSLDFRKDFERRLAPFVREHGIESKVIVLDDNRMDYWINDIEPAWSGAIPATLVRRGNDQRFYERTFHGLSELLDIVKPL